MERAPRGLVRPLHCGLGPGVVENGDDELEAKWTQPLLGQLPPARRPPSRVSSPFRCAQYAQGIGTEARGDGDQQEGFPGLGMLARTCGVGTRISCDVLSLNISLGSPGQAVELLSAKRNSHPHLEPCSLQLCGVHLEEHLQPIGTPRADIGGRWHHPAAGGLRGIVCSLDLSHSSTPLPLIALRQNMGLPWRKPYTRPHLDIPHGQEFLHAVVQHVSKASRYLPNLSFLPVSGKGGPRLLCLRSPFPRPVISGFAAAVLDGSARVSISLHQERAAARHGAGSSSRRWPGRPLCCLGGQCRHLHVQLDHRQLCEVDQRNQQLGLAERR